MAASSSSSSNRYAEQMKKLRSLHQRRNEARQLNHQEVVDEDKRNKLPPNWEARKRRAEWEVEDQQKREDAAAAGESYERVKLLDTPADEAARIDRAKMKRQANADPGFSSFEQASIRLHERLTKQIKPNLAEYEKEKEVMGEAFYPTTSTIIHGIRKDTKEGIDRMVTDLETQIKKKGKFNRRRRYDPDGDIDFINERNMNFNKKLERFYGKYTTEIKQNLERGTAV
jgi:pre-mRNA-splicing factor SYF2